MMTKRKSIIIGIHMLIFAIIATILIAYGVNYSDSTSRQTVYVGQRLIIYNKDLYLPGNLKVVEQNENYITVVARNVGKYNIYEKSSLDFPKYFINVKLGNSYSEYETLQDNKSEYVSIMIWKIIKSLLIALTITFLSYCLFNKNPPV